MAETKKKGAATKGKQPAKGAKGAKGGAAKSKGKSGAKPAAKKGAKPSGKKDLKAEAKRTETAAAAEDAEEVAEVEEKKKAVPRVKIKPQLDGATLAALEERRAKKARTPVFRRQEWFRYKKLSRSGWRKPTGIQSKMRRHFAYRPNVVSIGYAGPAAARGLHPSGFREVLVHRPDELEAMDPKREAARIAGGVGARKRERIEKEAERLKIRVLNPMRSGGEES